ncbi:MAG: hypothetical protein J6K84_03620 [Oscillospiraceae bacterium]|nr:hypothetical protein [Oscillospiraceae bacterium]
MPKNLPNATESLQEKDGQGGDIVLYWYKTAIPQLKIAKNSSALGGFYRFGSV